MKRQTIYERWAEDDGFGTPPKREKRFDPHQPRDRVGRWSDVPGGGLIAPSQTMDAPPPPRSTSSSSTSQPTPSGFGTSDAEMDEIFKDRKMGLPGQYGGEPFSNEIVDGVHQYTGSMNSFYVNDVLRGDRTILRDQQQDELVNKTIIPSLDSAMNPIGKPVQVFRKTRSDPHAIMPDFDRNNPSADVGKSYTDRGFGSTTTDELEAKQIDDSTRGTIWELNVSPKVGAIWGANPSERELLLQRGLRYTITKAEHTNPDGKKRMTPEWTIRANVEPA